MENDLDLVKAGLIDEKKPEELDTSTEMPDIPTDNPDDDPITRVAKLMKSLESSVAVLHIGFQMMEARMAQVERFVGYLLEQDPRMGEKVKAEAAKLNAKLSAELTETEQTTDDQGQGENA